MLIQMIGDKMGKASKSTSSKIARAVGTLEPGGELGKIAKRAKRKAPIVRVHDDPCAELRRLVSEHSDCVRRSVALWNSVVDKKNRTTGEVRKCTVHEALVIEQKRLSALYDKRARDYVPAIKAELKQLPIYDLFLKNVFGLGPIVSAYLVSQINFAIATKPSQVIRYCGLAVINGRLERPVAGEVNKFNKTLRVRIYQAMASMFKNSYAKPSREELAKRKAMSDEELYEYKKTYPKSVAYTSKYLKIWVDSKHRDMNSELYNAKANTWGNRHGARGIIHSKGWHKAAAVFLEDLYILGRTLAGLPVWPSYYAAKLGYSHGGKISVNAPKMLTVEEALELIGDVGGRALAGHVGDAAEFDSDDDFEEDGELFLPCDDERKVLEAKNGRARTGRRDLDKPHDFLGA